MNYPVPYPKRESREPVILRVQAARVRSNGLRCRARPERRIANVRKWPRLCQNTHARNGVSKSFEKTRTSVASFGILGVKLETTRLYASS